MLETLFLFYAFVALGLLFFEEVPWDQAFAWPIVAVRRALRKNPCR